MDDSGEKWFVVNFVEEGSVEIIPRKWYIASISKCFWPDSNYVGKITEAVKKSYSPGAWQLHPVKVFGEYSDFKTAERKVNKAKITDKLTSSENEVTTKRQRRPRKRLYDSTSESTSDESEPSECDYPQPPKKPLKNKVNSQDISTIEVGVHQPQVQSPLKNINVIERCDKSVEPEVMELQTPKSYCTPLRQPRNYSSDFERSVLRELYMINAKLNEHSENFHVLLKTAQPGALLSEGQNLDFLKYFPIKTEEDLLIVENLLQNKNQFNEIAKYLSLFGGTEVKLLTKKVLYKILSNNVGQLYSWEGAKKKKSFKALLIADLIIKAVRLNPSTKDATEDDIIKSIKTWLVKAKERNVKNLLNQQNNETLVDER